jgi:hypothetical protein
LAGAHRRFARDCNHLSPLDSRDSSPHCIRTLSALSALKAKLLRWIGDERIIVSMLKEMRNPNLIHPNSCISTVRNLMWDA